MWRGPLEGLRGGGHNGLGSGSWGGHLLVVFQVVLTFFVVVVVFVVQGCYSRPGLCLGGGGGGGGSWSFFKGLLGWYCLAWKCFDFVLLSSFLLPCSGGPVNRHVCVLSCVMPLLWHGSWSPAPQSLTSHLPEACDVLYPPPLQLNPLPSSPGEVLIDLTVWCCWYMLCNQARVLHLGGNCPDSLLTGGGVLVWWIFTGSRLNTLGPLTLKKKKEKNHCWFEELNLEKKI